MPSCSIQVSRKEHATRKSLGSKQKGRQCNEHPQLLPALVAPNNCARASSRNAGWWQQTFQVLASAVCTMFLAGAGFPAGCACQLLSNTWSSANKAGQENCNSVMAARALLSSSSCFFCLAGRRLQSQSGAQKIRPGMLLKLQLLPLLLLLPHLVPPQACFNLRTRNPCSSRAFLRHPYEAPTQTAYSMLRCAAAGSRRGPLHTKA